MSRDEFRECIRECLRGEPGLDPARAMAAVTHALHTHVSVGELESVRVVLPREVRDEFECALCCGEEQAEPLEDERSAPMLERGGRRRAQGESAIGDWSAML